MFGLAPEAPVRKLPPPFLLRRSCPTANITPKVEEWLILHEESMPVWLCVPILLSPWSAWTCWTMVIISGKTYSRLAHFIVFTLFHLFKFTSEHHRGHNEALLNFSTCINVSSAETSDVNCGIFLTKNPLCFPIRTPLLSQMNIWSEKVHILLWKPTILYSFSYKTKQKHNSLSLIWRSEASDLIVVSLMWKVDEYSRVWEEVISIQI